LLVDVEVVIGDICWFFYVVGIFVLCVVVMSGSVIVVVLCIVCAKVMWIVVEVFEVFEDDFEIVDGVV